MLKRFFIFMFVFSLIGCFYSKTFAENGAGLNVSNGYFSFVMPCGTEGTYIVEKKNNYIDIIEKNSAKSGEGGFAFGFKLFKSPADYANLEGYKKIGELTDKKGNLYDMTLARPVENRCADDQATIEKFLRLYDCAENVEIKGVNGSRYNKNQGIKGEVLYGEILKAYKASIAEKNKKLLNKIGYAYYDVNSDGIEELFIGKITKGKKAGEIHDIYTMVNRKPVHVLSQSYPEYKYFVCNDTYLCEENYTAKDKKTFVVTTLDKNSTKRPLTVKYMYDVTRNKKQPWYRTYRLDGYYESISQEMYTQGINTFDYYKKFDYIPLNALK